jgi:CubicO group peptidase (beta-lactamase class C family)
MPVRIYMPALWLFLLIFPGQNTVLYSQETGWLVPPGGRRTDCQSDNPRQSRLDLLVDSVAQGFMQNTLNTGLSIGLYTDGVTYFYNYGETRTPGGALPSNTTVYQLGALSTSFCGLLLAMAVTEKKIGPEDDIRKYLPGKYPGLVFERQPVRVRHLAHHSSGLPSLPADLTAQPGYDSLNPYKHYGQDKILEYLKRLELKKTPGTECEYSGLGIAVLGLILETVYQQPLESLIREKICRRIGMEYTAAGSSGFPPALLAQGYNAEGDPTPAWDLGAFAAAGGLSSCTADLLNYLSYHAEEKDTAAVLSHQVVFHGRQSMALGWFVKQNGAQPPWYWHNGGTFGFTGFMGFIRKKRVALIILANSATHLDHIGITLLNDLQR